MMPITHLVAVLLGVALDVSAVTPTECKVSISSPANGDTVGYNGHVAGTASIPAGQHLWVFTQREGAGNWWPFVPTDVAGTPGAWTADVHYAESSDVEAPVRLWAWAVDDARHAELLAQLALAIAVPIAETPDSQECDDERQLNRRP